MLRERSRSRDNGGRKDSSEAVLKVSSRDFVSEFMRFLSFFGTLDFFVLPKDDVGKLFRRFAWTFL